MKYLLYLLDYLYDYLNEKKLVLPLIQRYFKKKGDVLNIYINNGRKKKWSLSRSELGVGGGVGKTYDVLLLPLDRGINLKLDKKNETNNIIQQFISNNKKILGIKLTGNLECHNYGPQICYGIPSPYYYQQVDKGGAAHFIPATFNKFICPIVSESPLIRPSIMDKKLFYKKYKVPPKHKIIVLLPGNLLKLRKITMNGGGNPRSGSEALDPFMKQMSRRITWFFGNLVALKGQFEKLGWTILLKEYKINHKYIRNPYQKILKNFKEVSSDDVYSLYKYANVAMTIGTTIVFETYLFQIPVIEFGIPSYFFKWSYGDLNNYPLNLKLIKEYKNGYDLVNGEVVPANVLNSRKFVQWFLKIQKSLSQHKFKHGLNHPFYGNTQTCSLKVFHQIIKNNS